MADWDTLYKACNTCGRCGLAKTRTNVVIGDGNKSADIMLIGEGPGYNEDQQGIPFVGNAGHLLDKMLSAIGLTREDVYIANIVKCRPPNNRDPEKSEREACIPYLRYQLQLVRPKIIVLLGRVAAQAIISPDFKITQQRGQWFEKKGIYFIATYHPSALLRDEDKKRPAWEDFKHIKLKYESLKKGV
ncbi:uracil-DNA glycosylase [Anaeropeptidivorans aminofermentans]|jgi:DNA polymerase|uniref:uracil-DNA glycosylase n=1 Tax=Anaeropeptidivorans aminofermentans TaxID=2934315 RepID=UPI0020259FAF|nr:uracil-DNA glycosylase [Anaeropeptidivorans aminofermentans]MBE6012321.1 uracil-DNA glycosylase [Lachnospiraceae bacterium]